MLKFDMDLQFCTYDDAAEYLENISYKIRDGLTKGTGWRITGKETCFVCQGKTDKENPCPSCLKPDDSDFTGSTNDDR